MGKWRLRRLRGGGGRRGGPDRGVFHLVPGRGRICNFNVSVFVAVAGGPGRDEVQRALRAQGSVAVEAAERELLLLLLLLLELEVRELLHPFSVQPAVVLWGLLLLLLLLLLRCSLLRADGGG